MRKIISVFVAGLVLLAQSSFAATATYTVSATVPAASAIGINAFNINTASGNRTGVTGTILSFDPLVFQPSTGTYLPDHYFIIESGINTGSGNQDITIGYAEGTNPNGTGHGLGWKTVATFNMVTGPTTEVAVTGHSKKMLKDLTTPEHITSAQIGTNLLRMYVGVVTGNPSLAEPTGSEVITNADKSGAYSGTLTITATIV